MQNFVAKIVNMMKDEKLYYPQGGPIIISQVLQLNNTRPLHSVLGDFLSEPKI
jgi:hypothetical protein